MLLWDSRGQTTASHLWGQEEQRDPCTSSSEMEWDAGGREALVGECTWHLRNVGK
jgi:hypothetical protein